MVLLSLGWLFGCVEEINPSFAEFEELLVVEATLTDERQRQQVFLSKTFEFDENFRPLRGARVWIRNEGGQDQIFEETESGIYTSQTEFSVEPNQRYWLEISTAEGKRYVSQREQLPLRNDLDSIYATPIINDNGVDGIAIMANSFDEDGPLKNYRYVYEETYKVVAPKWRPETLVPFETEENLCAMERAPTDLFETCYATEISNTIIQTTTKDLERDKVDGFMVRFISSDNYVLSHRYSILVKQLIQSDASYAFYKTLRDLSVSESTFFENQTGFVQGNIKSESDASESVLGYFDSEYSFGKAIVFQL